MTTAGRILSRTDGSPLPGATLSAVRGQRAGEGGTTVGTATDANGNWSFPFTQFDVVRVHSMGHRDHMAAPGTLAPVVYLTEAVEELPTFTVTADRPGPSKGGVPLWLWALLAFVVLSDD